ncbi:MAG: ferredoxin [Gemmatimonas sp. SG8_38_2]|nr:MAG: ferredoxin [Gemmatimonas sp. SG8_38_2]
MSYKIADIEGIGKAYAEKLSAAKIATTGDLLDLCKTPQGRDSVSKTTGISANQLLKWTNLADLMRVSGVGSEYSELLEAAGVDTIKELKNRRADNLAAKMKEVNAAKKLTRMTPSAKVVQEWIENAAKLPPMITY